MNHLMLDLETLSTDDNAVVIAIGAVVFNDEHVVESLGWNLAFDDMTGHFDAKTIAWWMQQSAEAQAVTFGGDRIAPWLAGSELVELLRRHDIKTVWANDPHFDVTILKNWWERYSVNAAAEAGLHRPRIAYPWPFAYNQPRSFRTLVELGEQLGFNSEMRGAARGMYVAHNAVEDAAAQARVVIAIKRFISNGGVFHDRPFVRIAVAG
jgi:hypothetical protein